MIVGEAITIDVALAANGTFPVIVVRTDDMADIVARRTKADDSMLRAAELTV